MTPGARVAAAIDILDIVSDGTPAEQALTRWARNSRFAGSKDRAAVRDHVFDALRNLRSAAAMGGGSDGRALMIGLLRQQGQDPRLYFTGEGHAPAVLTAYEDEEPPVPDDRGTVWNLPDWILPEFERSLGPQADATARALSNRAPITVRVNTARTTRLAIIDALRAEHVETVTNPLAETALTATKGARRLRNTPAYQDGLIELQDGSSQAMIAELPEAHRCLDFCAGGGGKSLAMAAEGRDVTACDIDPARMRDLPVRAARAETPVQVADTASLTSLDPFDLVLCDAPCSGSGTWRRAPHAKWQITPERLGDLTSVQDSVLDDAMALVKPGGWLIYATCSVLTVENEDRIAAFLDRNPDWKCTLKGRLGVSATGDGFFSAHLTREIC